MTKAADLERRDYYYASDVHYLHIWINCVWKWSATYNQLLYNPIHALKLWEYRFVPLLLDIWKQMHISPHIFNGGQVWSVSRPVHYLHFTLGMQNESLHRPAGILGRSWKKKKKTLSRRQHILFKNLPPHFLQLPLWSRLLTQVGSERESSQNLKPC